MLLRHRKNLTILGLLVLAFLGFYFYSRLPQKYLEVDFLDVGQGDSVLIKTPQGQNILIDGGPDNSVIYQLGRTLSFFDRQIDLIILSHPQADHLTGLIEILKRFKVKKILITIAEIDTLEYLIWQNLIKEKDIEIINAQKISDIKLVDNLKLEILYPFSNINLEKLEDINDSSIILKLSFNDIDFLFTGDATYKIEEELIVNNINLEAEILKISHHGAKNATSKEFLEKVKPVLGVISVGENKFGHPAFRTLKSLEKQKVLVLTTKEQGTVKILSDGQTWWLKSVSK